MTTQPTSQTTPQFCSQPSCNNPSHPYTIYSEENISPDPNYYTPNYYNPQPIHLCDLHLSILSRDYHITNSSSYKPPIKFTVGGSLIINL